jgi:hypothetical protein
MGETELTLQWKGTQRDLEWLYARSVER